MDVQRDDGFAPQVEDLHADSANDDFDLLLVVRAKEYLLQCAHCRERRLAFCREIPLERTRGRPLMIQQEVVVHRGGLRRWQLRAGGEHLAPRSLAAAAAAAACCGLRLERAALQCRDPSSL
jgi:hypothetical protein